MTNVSTIGIANNNVPSAIVTGGTSLWNSCQQAGSTMPIFVSGSSGNFTASATYHTGNNPQPNGACGYTDIGTQNGRLVSANVHLFERTSTGNPCGRLSETFAHELGHVLGLDNASSSACDQRIMGQYNSTTPRNVTSLDCAAAAEQFVLPNENDGGSNDHPCQGPRF